MEMLAIIVRDITFGFVEKIQVCCEKVLIRSHFSQVVKKFAWGLAVVSQQMNTNNFSFISTPILSSQDWQPVKFGFDYKLLLLTVHTKL